MLVILLLFGQQVGLEGTTGVSTGIHLHLEQQDLTNREWSFDRIKENYKDPADFMGFPDIKGVSVIYDGTPIPPTPSMNKNIKKWFLSRCKKIRIFT